MPASYSNFASFPLEPFQGPLLHISELVRRRRGRSGGQLDEPGAERQRRLRVQAAHLEVPRGIHT